MKRSSGIRERCSDVFRHFLLNPGWPWLALIVASLSVFGVANGGRDCNGFDIKCVNGQCVDESQARSKSNESKSNGQNKTPKVVCQCDQWWSGPSCDIFSCSGRMHLKPPGGVITDGTGNYTTDNKCTWLIDGGGLDLPVRLKFDDFATECGWDHLYIFDGMSVSAPLIGVLSGLIVPQNSPNNVIPELTASSGSAYLYFYSDAAYNMSGFTINYKYALCSENCSGHGECLSSDTCQCFDGWTGVGCETSVCPNNCSLPNGTCSISGCQCKPGYRGADCSVPSNKGVWTKVNSSSLVNGIPRSVASHSSFIFQRHLWIVGGYSFQLPSTTLKLFRFSFDTNTWDEVNMKSVTGSDVPGERYGHSTVVYQSTVYMFGGIISSTVTDELWQLKPETNIWSKVSVLGMTKPLAAVGHTAQIVDSVMFVFFGYNPTYGFLNTVQCFSAENQTWGILNTTGAIVKGGYGASSVYDSVNRTILIHGGYQSDSASAYSLMDVLYAFDPVNHSWRILRSSGQFKYLHSAAILGRYMFVYGGNTHNDTSISQGAKCYSLDFMAYDIDCDKWLVLDQQPLLIPSAARYGHSADVFNGDMYVFGGFNGVLLSDLLVYQTGQCSSFTKEECLSSKKEGLSCALVDERECTTLDAAEMRLNLKNITKIDWTVCDTPPQATCEKDKLKTCPSCVVNSQECVWCGSECQSKQSSCSTFEATSEEQCYANFSQSSESCVNLHNCHACSLEPGCTWGGYDSSNKCDVLRPGQVPSNKTCDAPCFSHSTCENCTRASCMWCGNQVQCVESNAYVSSFPYGQCMEWTTISSRCAATRCADLRTCSQCQQNPACGWCDDGTNTGLGQCMDGGLEGPITSLRNHCANSDWHFTSCPLCQCNGHSNCSENSSICLSCSDMTTGPNCEYCQEGFWGHPVIGGNCSACECNSQADYCRNDTGFCYCRTRGIVGDHCQECDKAHKYFGDPLNGGTCYYEMAIDWIFTFNLSSEENKYYTQINFMNTPPAKDKDVDFSITCSSNASMNMSVKNANDAEEQFLFLNYSCRSFTSKFSYKEFNFGSEHNTTFYVYVYNFQTPFTLQIYFSQNEQLDLFRFFVTFFSCFFSLLLIAFVSWKLKQRYDLYRRGQRQIQEMAQMANRPFSACILEMDSPEDDHTIEQPLVRSSGRRIRKCKATPVTVEPLFGQKAAVLSVIVRLPRGDEDYTPLDQSGLAIGSALVTLGAHSRQGNVDPSKPERTNKHRKKPNVAITNSSPDVV